MRRGAEEKVYQAECPLYHQREPQCNSAHPAKPSVRSQCPVYGQWQDSKGRLSFYRGVGKHGHLETHRAKVKRGEGNLWLQARGSGSKNQSDKGVSLPLGKRKTQPTIEDASKTC